MNREEEYSYRIKNRTPDELQKAKKYSCDGICYGNKFMCPRVEECKETACGEFISTIFAIIFYIFIIIIANPITWIIISIFIS